MGEVGIKHMENMINQEIKANSVKLVGQNLGYLKLGSLVTLNKALEMAKDAGLDLVMVGGDDTVSVCKIMDYAKHLYEKQQKEKLNRKYKQETKEVKLTLRIAENDMKVKAATVQRILKEGDKVKVSIVSKGREVTYIQRGLSKLDILTKMISCEYVVEKQARIEGHKVYMTLAPYKHID